MDPHDDTTLAALLDAGEAFDCTYGGGLSDHRPMALVALRRLGADDARLADFARRYEARLEPAPPPQPWPSGQPWREHFGQRALWPAYRSLFRQWVGEEGSAETLAQVLPWLLPGCGGAAFHGLIRTAQAARSGHRGALADGLADWACHWLPLGPADPQPGDPEPRPRDLHGVRAALDAALAAVAGARLDGGLIVERMDAVAGIEAFLAAVDRFAVDASHLDALAALAAGLYADSGDFAALHLVTSAHALRVLLPFVQDRDEAVRHYWHAFAAGACVAELRPRAPVEAQPWDALVAAAVASDDEHAVKLVDAARELARATAAADGDDLLWRRCAARALA